MDKKGQHYFLEVNPRIQVPYLPQSWSQARAWACSSICSCACMQLLLYQTLSMLPLRKAAHTAQNSARRQAVSCWL